MANQSSTGFGLRPLRKVGQNDDNAGLSEWKKASGSAAINHHELVQLLSTGYVLSAAAGGPALLGSLNGSFYTAPTTLKPTWSNYAPSIVASDHTCLINDDPYQMYEMMTALTNYTDPGNAGSTADIVATGGSGSPNYISGFTLGTAATTADVQMKVIGLTRDTLSQDVSVAGSVWRCMVNEHILGSNSLGI
jgi:hypothetical protein